MTADEAEGAGFVDIVIKDGKEKSRESDAENELNSQQSTTTQKLMFKSDKDLNAKLEASQAEVAEHEATIAKREAESVTLTEDLAAANEKATEQEASIVDLTAQIETGKAEFEEATKENETVKAELKVASDKLETFDDEVDTAAQAKVAALGHNEPLDMNEEPENLTGIQRAIAAHKKPSK
jgi:chromosome segregation ATPase